MAPPDPPSTAAASDSKHTDLNIPQFITPVDTEEAALQWQKWRRNFERKLRFFRVTTLQDKLDALAIYGGEEIEELTDNLPNIADAEVTVPEGEEINEFHRAIAKLNNHFTPMLNKDSARSVFEQMTQGDQTMAKYYVALKKQAEKCKFPDADDSIRSKILQTMNDKKLRREAMLREYDLSNLLKHAANKEDVERQAASMEKAATEQVNRVYEQRKSNSIYRKKYKPPPKQERKTTAQKTCPFCGDDHDGPRTKCPASGKTCSNCCKKGHFTVVCRHKNRKRADHVSDQAMLEDSEEDEYAFSITASKKRPTVMVLLNGVKGRMDADSCASANIMDREQFEKITAASNTPVELVPASNNLYAYGQENPIKLRGKFTAPIQSIVTGRKTVPEFLVMENKANSRPLMSLETATRLGLLHIANSMQTQNDAYAEMREKHAEVLEEIRTATKEDEDFQRLIQYIHKGKEQATVSQRPRAPLQMTETPSKPWENVAADFCGPYPSGELILVVIDERTRYPEVEIVNNTSAESTIIAMEKMFATHGYPEKLKSDNGPPFKSQALREFFTEKGITHHRVTPRWPEANGLAENFMKSVGKVIKTANMENKNWRRELFRFLANYRQNPHPNAGKSPRLLMFQREIRGKLPNMIQEEEKDDIKERDTAIKAKQKEKLDEKRRTKEHTIKKGDLVLVKQEKTNKLSTPYGPTPHIVERVKGSMITATRGNARTTRNSSFFKKIEGNAEDIKLEEENNPDIDEPESEEIEEEIINENVEVDQEYRSRSGRIIRKPKYLDDFET